MLADKFFTWNYGSGLEQAIADMKKVFEKFRWPDAVDNMIYGSLLEHIAFQCRYHNISPQWLMVSAQREQGCFNGKLADWAGIYPQKEITAAIAWLGVVGEDVGRVKLPGYYGMFQQVNRFTEQCAWLLGILPIGHWPTWIAVKKASRRYNASINMQIMGSDQKQIEFKPLSAGEYLQASFTPHIEVIGRQMADGRIDHTNGKNEQYAKELGFI